MKANRNMKKNDEAVSPVIGVILMVAITVILAAVIGAFVFGMGPKEEAPQASLRMINNGTSFDIEHQGGDDINRTSMRVMVNGGNETDAASLSTGLFVAGERIYVSTAVSNGDEVVVIDGISKKMIGQGTIRK